MEEGCGPAKAGHIIVAIVTVARDGIKLYSDWAPRPSHHPPAVHYAALLVHSYGCMEACYDQLMGKDSICACCMDG